MSEKVQLDLDILLPEIPDEKDQCVQRLQQLGQQQKGIEEVHLDYKNGKAVLCIHFDTEFLTLAQVERLMTRAGAQLTKKYNHDTMHITDMDCADCATSIEHIVQRMDGVLDVVVNYAAEKIRVEYDAEKLSRDDIIRMIRSLGYQIEEPERPKTFWQRHFELILSLLSGLFLATGYILESWIGVAEAVYFPLYVLAYLTGGYDATRHGIKAAMKLKFDIDFLMVVAAIGAAVLGNWAEGALLLFLFSLGHALEHSAMDRAREAIKALGAITPKTARVRRDGREVEIGVEELQRGDVVILRSGERVPIDGKIIRGSSELDESPITGESVPRYKEAGDTVFAGTINGEGTLEIEVTKLAKDTTLARIIQLVEEAQTQKAPSQKFVQRVTRIFVPATLITVVLLIFIPPLFNWLSWEEAFFRAMSTLVAASPCALAIATPSAILAGIAQAARNGVLVKGGVHLENLGGIQAITFDKTGTLTIGRPRVTEIISLDETPERELLRIAAGLESRSNHPLARAILERAASEKLSLPSPEQVESITGKGLAGRIGTDQFWIGNRRLFNDQTTLPESIETRIADLESRGHAVVLIRKNAQFIGIIALSDQPREQAAPTIARLKKLGIRHQIMLTGDNAGAAASIASRIGITEFYANLLPHQKVEKVRELLKKYRTVAMVGDGVNDAPALAAATVGIAMGSAGSDVALETADVALMSDAIENLPFAVGLSRQARKIIRQNIFISFGVIAMLIPSTIFGLATMGIAILFHEGSTLVVVSNALRLLRYRSV